MGQQRYDLGTLSASRTLPGGRLVVDAHLTRSGVFTYRNPDGSQRLEYRPPAEVFKADSLDSFAFAPVTNDHPPEMVDAKNAAKFSVGSVGETIRQDGDHVAAKLVINDATMIAAMRAGKRDVSCGYECDLVETPGVTPDGIRYDAIQTNIIGNHLAIVASGRAGSARVRMDASVMELDSVERKDSDMDLTKALADLAAAQKELGATTLRADQAEKLAAEHKSALDKSTARADSLAEELASEKKLRTDAAAAAPAAVRARVDLETKAATVMPKEFKLDALDDRAIQVAVIKHVTGVEIAADKSNDYVAARYDAAIERASISTEVFQRTHAQIDASRAVKEDAGEQAKAEHRAQSAALFIQPGTPLVLATK